MQKQSNEVTVRLALVGPNAGKTRKCHNTMFIDGVADVLLSGNANDTLNYWATFYNAFPIGSPAYNQAVADYEELTKEKAEEEKEVIDEVHTEKDGTDGEGSPIRTPLKPKQPAEPTAQDDDDGAGSAEAEGDTGNDDANRDRYRAQILEAFTLLDDENDDHWNDSGEPYVSLISSLIYKPDLTREQIEAANPGFRRWHEDDDDVDSPRNN